MFFVEHNVFCGLITGFQETFRNGNFPIQSVMLMVRGTINAFQCLILKTFFLFYLCQLGRQK